MDKKSDWYCFHPRGMGYLHGVLKHQLKWKCWGGGLVLALATAFKNAILSILCNDLFLIVNLAIVCLLKIAFL